MRFLVAFIFLILPVDADYVNKPRVHVSDKLKVKCDALPYRSTYTGTRCYFAVAQEVLFKDAPELCSSIFRGSKFSSDAPSAVFRSMMIESSAYRVGTTSGLAKRIIYAYDSGYKCDGGDATQIPGKCAIRADGKKNFVQAYQYCKSLGMELPLLGNDNDNRVLVGILGKNPAWIQHTFAKTGTKFVWQHENNYTRFGACDKTKSNPPQHPASHVKRTWECNKVPVASVIDKSGYWSNVGQHHSLDAICMKNAENQFTARIPCAGFHELDQTTGECKWIGPKDACIQLIDYRNRSWFMPLPGFPKVVHREYNLFAAGNPQNDYAVKVIVRKGCMFTGYEHSETHSDSKKERILVENLIYGEHTVPSVMNGLLKNKPDGLTRPNCYCDPAEATLNGHVPSPPPNRQCIEHHTFDEVSQNCEWTKEAKFCGELITKDGRRMMLEIPRWPLNRKYDVDHRRPKNENFHTTISNITVRQHCFATLLNGMSITSGRTLRTSGYGNHKVNPGTRRVICECIR